MTKLLSNNLFGENLRNIRNACNLSQDETINRLSALGSPLSRSTYSLIEMGRGNIYVSDLVGLQKVFNVDFAKFFEGIDVPR